MFLNYIFAAYMTDQRIKLIKYWVLNRIGNLHTKIQSSIFFPKQDWLTNRLDVYLNYKVTSLLDKLVLQV